MKKSTAYLDVLRLMATILVVLIHTVSGVLSLVPSQMTGTQIVTYGCIKSICSIGVPIFLMISGALFLNPEKKISLKDLFFKYIRRIVLALLIFGTGYALIEIVFNTRDFKPIYLWDAFYNMLIGNTWAHMWYLYMILLIYMLIPVLKPFVASSNKATYSYVILILMIASSVAPFIRSITGFSFGLGISSVQIPEFAVYVFYFLTGYYVHDLMKKESRNGIAIASVLAVLSLVVIILNAYLKLGMSINYDSPVVLVLATSVFYIFGRLKLVTKISVKLRPYLFGIYLIHAFYLNLLYKFIGITPLECGGYILIPVFVLGVFILSAFTVWIMRLIPPIKKYIL